MIIILTCKVGDKIINCYDGTYNKEQLKKWADKNILLCPACGKPYEYCHGKVKTPYFRHKDKEECEDKYSESETNEHLNGKIKLFEWIKKQDFVTDAILEGWIPETKQRPDIMFKYNDKQYVIEYQCTPIATEYYERHELYELAGIEDIWICGINKYFGDTKRYNTLEKEYNNAGYYDTSNNNFIFSIKSRINLSFLKSMNNFKINYTEIISKCNRDRFVSSNMENIKIFENKITFKGLDNVQKIENIINKRRQRDKTFKNNLEKFYEAKIKKIYNYIKDNDKNINYNLDKYYVENDKIHIKINTNSDRVFKYKDVSNDYVESIVININSQSIYKKMNNSKLIINKIYSELYNVTDKLDNSLFYFTKINTENKINIYLKNSKANDKYKKLEIKDYNLKYFNKPYSWKYHGINTEFNFISSFINELKFLNKNKYSFNLYIDNCDFTTIDNQNINVRNYVTIIGYLYSIGFKNLEIHY